MPILTTSVIGSPVAPFHIPPLTDTVKARIRAKISPMARDTSSPSTGMGPRSALRSAQCKTARFSVVFIFSPPDHAVPPVLQFRGAGQVDQIFQNLVGYRIFGKIEKNPSVQKRTSQNGRHRCETIPPSAADPFLQLEKPFPSLRPIIVGFGRRHDKAFSIRPTAKLANRERMGHCRASGKRQATRGAGSMPGHCNLGQSPLKQGQGAWRPTMKKLSMRVSTKSLTTQCVTFGLTARPGIRAGRRWRHLHENERRTFRHIGPALIDLVAGKPIGA